ncbi:hypothetical protein [Streptomyces mutabilis]|uniref:hypothetical protein n=1 Tax=Streptomyces mutabilis TaxID=67332 RepID=UPI0012B68476|nr:hypothetical protein [Streptomyces mutabilis]
MADTKPMYNKVKSKGNEQLNSHGTAGAHEASRGLIEELLTDEQRRTIAAPTGAIVK